MNLDLIGILTIDGIHHCTFPPPPKQKRSLEVEQGGRGTELLLVTESMLYLWIPAEMKRCKKLMKYWEGVRRNLPFF